MTTISEVSNLQLPVRIFTGIEALSSSSADEEASDEPVFHSVTFLQRSSPQEVLIIIFCSFMLQQQRKLICILTPDENSLHGLCDDVESTFKQTAVKMKISQSLLHTCSKHSHSTTAYTF